MAFLDPAREAIVIRIVYDGAPMAGKTTSVRALAAGVGGRAVTPREVEGRTLYFDWLDYTGGLFEGRRIHCQIVSVPGQALLAARRRRIVESADAVVFVSDSRPEPHAEACDYLAGLNGILRDLPAPPVGVIVQANKRDDPRALPLCELRASLDRAGLDVGLVESVATEGTGIREAFVFAVRLALDRVSALMQSGAMPTARPAIDSPEDLLADLLGGDGDAVDRAAAPDLAASMRHVEDDEAASTTPAAAAISLVLQRESATTAPAAKRPRKRPSPRRGAVPALPGHDVSSSLIWPPVEGRLRAHEALAACGEPAQETNGDWKAVAAGWTLHSPADAVFASVDDGRRALLEWARAHATGAATLSERRCLVLADDGAGGHRLWQIVATDPSLRDSLGRALDDGPPAIAASLVDHAAQLLDAAEAWSSCPLHLPLSLRTVGVATDPLRFVGPMPYPPLERDGTAPPADSAVLRRLGIELAFALPLIEPIRGEVQRELGSAAARWPRRRAQTAGRFLRELLASA